MMKLTTLALLISCILHAQTSFAVLAGHNSKGDYGLQSGSQLPPGFYMVAPLYYRYDADTLRNREGKKVSIL